MGLFNWIFGGNLDKAITTLQQEDIRNQDRRNLGGVQISPVKTDLGTAYTDTQLNDYVTQMQNEWKKQNAPQVLGEEIAPQYQPPTDLAPEPAYEIQYPEMMEYIINGYPGSRVTEEYYKAMEQALDEKTLANVLAMSIAETGAGRDASNFQGDGGLKNSNFWGYFKGGDRTYDPDTGVMIEDLQHAFGPGGAYEEITPQTLAYYVHGKAYDQLSPQQKESVDAEYGRYLWGMAQLGY